ncbi:MAG: hypothetical protein QF412_12695 [Planctomycetota bacterium]|jgi:hypothetical protein|nr:hypothetical protein [Planctomycetota bacterium]
MLGTLIAALLALLLLDAGCRVAGRLCAHAPCSAQVLSGAVLGSSWLLVLLLALGSVESIYGAWVAIGVIAFWLAPLGLKMPSPLAGFARKAAVLLVPRQREWSRAVAAWFLVGICGYAICASLVAPTAEYDALSYHLPYTATIIDSGGIPLLDTPFGDSAQAYQPKNDAVLRSLFSLFGSDEQLTWCGALPHLLLLLLSIHVAARALGSSRRASLWGAATLMISPLILQQARGAMVDLPLASWWFAFAALGLRSAGRPAMALIAGLALGLAYGTKYLAVPFTPMAMLVLLAAWLHWKESKRGRSMMYLALGVLITGSFFYLRNWALTGNPIYPVQIELFGQVLLEGNYGADAMRAWVFNLSEDPSLPLWTRLAAAFAPLTGFLPGDLAATLTLPSGLLVLAVPIVLWIVGSAASLRRPEVLLMLAIAPLIVAACWWVIPFQYGRFAFLAVACLGVAATRVEDTRGLRHLVPILIGLHLILTRETNFPALAAAGAAVAVVAITHLARLQTGQPLTRARATATVAIISMPAIALAGILAIPADRVFLNKGHPSFAEIWAKTDQLDGDGPIAYAGNNLPYPLRGPRARPVIHVPIDGRSNLRFHDRAQAWRNDGLSAAICPEPGFYRRRQDAAAWLADLRQRGVEFLVVTRLTAQQLLNIRHDPQGFPIEATWARAAEPALALVEEDATAMIFRLHPDLEPAKPLPVAIERREPDAFALLSQPSELGRHYPLSIEELTQPRYARTLELSPR